MGNAYSEFVSYAGHFYVLRMFCLDFQNLLFLLFCFHNVALEIGVDLFRGLLRKVGLRSNFFFWIKGNFFCWKETKYLPSTIIRVHLMLSPLIIFCFSKKKKIQLYNIICPILFKSFHDSWVEFMILVALGIRPL